MISTQSSWAKATTASTPRQSPGYTASDGTVTLPSNHVSKFDNPWTNTMYKGAQNTNPGLLPIQREDYSTASFYRAKVTGGENQLIIRTKKPTLGPNNKIMY